MLGSREMTSNFLSKRKSGTTHCPSQQMLRRKRGDGESKRAEGLLLSSPSSLKVELTLYTGDFLFILRKLPEDALHQDEGEKHDMESGTQGIHIKNPILAQSLKPGRGASLQPHRQPPGGENGPRNPGTQSFGGGGGSGKGGT